MAKKERSLFAKLADGDRRPEVVELVRNLKSSLPDLEKTLKEVNGHWTYEDGVYRFYHQSFKVFFLQEATLKVVETLKKLTPKPGTDRTRPRFYFYSKKHNLKESPSLHPWFMKVVSEGTGKTFDLKDNDRWLEATRPILEAFFHAKFFLEMAVQYGREFKRRKFTPSMLPSGWAAFLYLYDLR